MRELSSRWTGFRVQDHFAGMLSPEIAFKSSKILILLSNEAMFAAVDAGSVLCGAPIQMAGSDVEEVQHAEAAR